MKRRFSENDLEELVIKQQQILTRASSLVKPGGRLIYATCSLFMEENDQQNEKFLKEHPAFHLIPIGSIWTSVLGTACPMNKDTLQLTPHLHKVDGFFMAVMERVK
jgi:16S rRNA (cytosine967-C5)-methyltransferase